MAQPADGGQAASYYNAQQNFGGGGYAQPTAPPPAQMGQPGVPEPKAMPPQQYQQYQQQPQYQPPPPQQGGYAPGPPPPNDPYEPPGDGKHTFTEAFKLQKPKYNDIWAAVLVRCSPFLQRRQQRTNARLVNTDVLRFRGRLGDRDP